MKLHTLLLAASALLVLSACNARPADAKTDDADTAASSDLDLSSDWDLDDSSDWDSSGPDWGLDAPSDSAWDYGHEKDDYEW